MSPKLHWFVRDTGKQAVPQAMTAKQFAQHLERNAPGGMLFRAKINSDSEVRVTTDVRITTYVGKR